MKTEKICQSCTTTIPILKLKPNGISFATAHGNGPCDGLAEIIKRLGARRATTSYPRDLYVWARKSVEDVSFVYVSNESYAEKTQFLDDRFSKVLGIIGKRWVITVLFQPLIRGKSYHY